MTLDTKPEVPTVPPETPRPEARRRPLTLLWRVAAIAVVVAATVFIAQFLANPEGVEPGAPPGTLPGAGPGANTGDSPGPGGAATRDVAAERQRVTNDLRQKMAGLIMAAADPEDGADPDDPKQKDAAARRRAIADRFGLPFDYPRSQAPAGLAPKEAEVIVVFESPQGDDARMVLVRMRKPIADALADIHRQYAADGWKTMEPLDPKAQTDRGWLVRFTRKGQDRIVYAQPRQSADETLVAIYDARY